MPKKIEDIVAPEKRKSIRDVPIPENRRKSIINALPTNVDRVAPSSPPPTPPLVSSTAEDFHSPPASYQDFMAVKRGNKKGGGSKLLWLGVIFGGLVLAFILMTGFGGATLSYTPRSMEVSFQGETFTATKSGTESLSYSVVKMTGDKGKVVPASGEETVSEKASGIIIVYNADSTTPKPLLIDTRFETPEGLVFMVPKPITIPGKKVVGGKTEPGSLEITVYAEKPGANYNIGLTDFTLPGFKGTPRFETVYARAKTPMTGGFVGVAKEVSKEDLALARQELEEALRSELLTQTSSQVPEDFTLFPSLASITFRDLPQSDATEESVTVNLAGDLNGVMFKKTDLARYLVSGGVELSPSEVVAFESVEGLNVSWETEAPADLLATEAISFKVDGTALLVWRTDESNLKMDLAGKSKAEVQGIVGNFPSISSADVVIRPLWRGSFPLDPQEITVKSLPVE